MTVNVPLDYTFNSECAVCMGGGTERWAGFTTGS